MDGRYRYQLERYRGRGTRYVCPNCGRKYAFTRYIDTNTNTYVNDRVGKCNRLDKCGYHYTPRQYFEDNPWLRSEDNVCSIVQTHRVFEQLNIEQRRTTPPSEARGYGVLPLFAVEPTLNVDCHYKAWLRSVAGAEAAEEVIRRYKIGGYHDEGAMDCAIFWQQDIEGRYRTGKIMNFDPATGKRIKGEGAYIDWVHSVMRREGVLPEGWELRQCLYGEALLAERRRDVVALAEGAKTAHIGSLLLPDMVWVATDSMTSLGVEMLGPLAGRSVVLFPDEGRGYREWQQRIEAVARRVGFEYVVSDFMERAAPNTGGDIADLLVRGG